MATILMLLGAGVGVAERLDVQRTFDVAASFDDVCDAILTSRELQRSIYQTRPHYVGSDRWPDRGYAFYQVRTTQISVLRDVVLMIEVWRGEKTTVRLRSSGRIVRFPLLVKGSALRRMASEMRAKERMIREELEREVPH